SRAQRCGDARDAFRLVGRRDRKAEMAYALLERAAQMFQFDRQRRARVSVEWFYGDEDSLAREPVGLIVRRVNEPAGRTVGGCVAGLFAEERFGLDPVSLIVHESVFEADLMRLRIRSPGRRRSGCELDSRE